jgi:hypothetical protein
MVIENDTDWLLEKIICKINGTDNKLPITILVDGVSISGNLVSAHKYYEYIKDKVVEPKQISGEIDEHNLVLDILISGSSRSITDERDPYRRIGFIHIADAVFHSGRESVVKVGAGVFWRGVLDKISGFYLNV